ncbi:MAG: thiol:disulfide interchange protein DsbA [Arsenophonus sp. ET-DL9-MAG3]
MNKFLVTLTCLLISYNISATNYTEGTEFITIQKTVQNKLRVVEFFSFYCSHCYQFESIYHISQTIAKNLPKKIKMERYHVDFFGKLGPELTKAWTVAIVLKIEDKISPLLFEGIQKTESINTLADIKAVFIKVGIKSEEYDTALNSFIVKSLIIKQQKAVKDFQLHSVPTIFVNDKYMLCSNGINVKDFNNYAETYSDIVNFLVNK